MICRKCSVQRHSTVIVQGIRVTQTHASAQSSSNSSCSSSPDASEPSTRGGPVHFVNGGNGGSGAIGSSASCQIIVRQGTAVGTEQQNSKDSCSPKEQQNLVDSSKPAVQPLSKKTERPYAAAHGAFQPRTLFAEPSCTRHAKLANALSAPSALCSNKVEGPTSSVSTRSVAMDRLRRSFRDSFRKKKENSSEASKPHQWQHDEAAVRAATCAFPVKYLGCVEVFESRGMQVCEEALKVLRASRRRPIRGMLHVSGDGLRVVDDETKGLLVDQTIEKVSFCAPDRNHERGFSYICRDGTTRRWMCHGFVAIKETGERLSHAVGCAFAACLDRKQKRDKECGVTMTFDQSNSTFTRMGSFKQMSITDRLADPQECKPSNNGLTSPTSTSAPKSANPHAIARPHATPLMLQRQGSCRAFHHLNQSSPFKRQLSLRLNDLPSNLERQRDSNSLLDNLPSSGGQSFPSDAYNNNNSSVLPAGAFPRAKTTTPIIMSAIPEVASESSGGADPVSAMCQQLSQELSLMTSSTAATSTQLFSHSTAVASGPAVTNTSPFVGRPVSPKVTGSILVPSVEPIREDVPWAPASATTVPATTTAGSGVSKAEEWLAQFSATSGARVNGVPAPVASGTNNGQRRNPPLSQLRANTVASSQPQHVWNPVAPATDSVASVIPAQMMPLSSQQQQQQQQQQRQVSNFSTTLPSNARPDPLDMPWPTTSLNPVTNPPPVVNPNNPFLPAASKAFEVQM